MIEGIGLRAAARLAIASNSHIDPSSELAETSRRTAQRNGEAGGTGCRTSGACDQRAEKKRRYTALPEAHGCLHVFSNLMTQVEPIVDANQWAVVSVSQTLCENNWHF